MEKQQSEELNTRIAERGTAFLNEVINSGRPHNKSIESFYKDIVSINKQEADEIVLKYIQIEKMIFYAYELYRDNISYFEKEILQLNSIISTSLSVEQHIHDLQFNKDLSLKSNRKSNVENLKEVISGAKKILEKQEEKEKQPFPSRMNEEEKANIIELENSIKERMQDLITTLSQQLADAEEQEKKTQNQIKASMQNEYYIGTLSQDENLLYIFKGILEQYISNDILEGLRDAFFKEYQIKITMETPPIVKIEKGKPHCLRVSAYEFTINKIAKLMELSLLDKQQNVIDDKMLKQFTLLINLKEETQKAKYKNRVKKHILEAFEEMEAEKEKDVTLACCVMSHAEEILQELRWCDID